MKDYITTFRFQETNDNLKVYMVTQETTVSPEVVVMYVASINMSPKKKHCQSLALYRSHFCLVTQREGVLRDKTKRLHHYAFNPLLCRHERCVTKQKNLLHKTA